MGRRNLLLAFTLILLVLVSLSPSVTGADYTILLEGDHFNVTWRINTWQNLTGFPGYPTNVQVLPANLNTSLSGKELTAFATALQKSLQAKVSTVEVTDLRVKISSNSPSFSCAESCPRQWLNITVQFQVRDNPQRSGSVAQYNMAWKAVRIEDDLQAGGVSFNRLGGKYLLEGLVPFVSFPTSFGRSMRVTIGNPPLPVTNTTYQAPTANVVLLDFSAFQMPLESWSYTPDLITNKQTWAGPKEGGLKIHALLTISETETPVFLNYLEASQVSADVSAPLDAFVKGDTLSVDTSGGLWERIGLITILGSLGIWAGTVIVERRITRTPWTRRKKEKR